MFAFCPFIGFPVLKDDLKINDFSFLLSANLMYIFSIEI